MKTKHTLSPSQFPQELSQVITDGEKHGISDDLMLKGMISVGNLMGKLHFSFFPAINASEVSPFGLSVFAAYLFLCICIAQKTLLKVGIYL